MSDPTVWVVGVLLTGLYCNERYSDTKIRNTMFSFSTVDLSMALALSDILCQTLGNGDEIICRIGTPFLSKGLWSSSIPEPVPKIELKFDLVRKIRLRDVLKPF